MDQKLTEMTTRHSRSVPMDETDIDSILTNTKSEMEADKEKVKYDDER